MSILTLVSNNKFLVWIILSLELTLKNFLCVLFQGAKQETADLSVFSFLHQMLAENAEQEVTLLVKLMDKTAQFSNGGYWVVKDSLDAIAAAVAFASKRPEYIKFIRQDEGKSILKPLMISSILNNATKRTTVRLLCLDSFFGGEEKSQDWRELLSVCLNNDK